MLPGRLWKGKGVLIVSDWEIILTFNDSHRWDGGSCTVKNWVTQKAILLLLTNAESLSLIS